MRKVANSSLVLISTLVLISLSFIWPRVYNQDISTLNSHFKFDIHHSQGSDSQTIIQISSQGSFQYENHSPITIVGNDAFFTQAEENNWSGNGSLAFPIVITELNITGDINIKNTDVYFQISNCILNRGQHGIYLANVTNGYLFNNIIINSIGDGIYLYESDNNILSGNTIDRPNVGFLFEYGIYLYSSDDNILSSNIITNREDNAICLRWSKNNTLSNNTIINNNWSGICLDYSEKNILFENTITDNKGHGIFLYVSHKNILFKNTITNNREDFLYLLYSGNNIISDNILGIDGILITGLSLEDFLQTAVINNSANGKPLVFWQNRTGGTIPHGASQVILINSNSIEVSNQNMQGMQGAYCSNLFIHNNTLHEIILYSSNNSILSGNTITNNSNYGIILTESYHNRVLFNILSGNNEGDFQAYDNGSNNTFRYNYWNDWTSPDADHDGIVDEPYTIDGSANNLDQYPLVILDLSQSHFIFGLKISSPNGGETLHDTVTIVWTAGSDSMGHTITYTVSYSSDNGATWVILESGLTATSYIWDTTIVENGNYFIKVNASCAEGSWDADISDGSFTINNLELLSFVTSTDSVMTIDSIVDGIPDNIIGGLIILGVIIAVIILRKIKPS